MAEQKLDLLLVISPININYLIGAAAKAYQVFQCLLFPRDGGPLTLLLRLSDVAEVTDLSLADEVRGWGGVRTEHRSML
jgi:Xaa-Pro aminopeptidase